MAGQGVARIVQIERAALGLTMEQVQLAAQRLWASPFYHLLRRHIADLCTVAPTLAGGDSTRLATVTADLASTLLRSGIPAGKSAFGAAFDDYLIERIALCLRNNFQRPELAAQEIAYAHNISVSYLYQRWSTQPHALAETLLDIRLAAARQLLTAWTGLPIVVIAHRCGFRDSSHLRRRFNATFGISPGQYRATAPST